MSEVRLDGVGYVPKGAPHARADSLWKQTANKIVAFIKSLRAALHAWFHPKPVSQHVYTSPKEPEPLLSRVNVNPPPAAPIVEQVAPAVLAPKSLVEKTPVVLTDIVMNVVDFAMKDLADDKDPIKKAVSGWIKTAAKDKTTEMGQVLGKIFADMDYAFLFDQIIKTVNDRLENVVEQNKRCSELREMVNYHREILNSWFSSQEAIDESLDFFAQTFKQTPDAVNEESIRKVALESQKVQAPMDFKPVVKELLEMLDLNKPLAEVSPEEKAARTALFSVIAEKIPGAKPERLERILHLEEANSLIAEALEEHLNTVFKGIFAKLGSQQFLNHLFGKTIFPKITEALKDQMRPGPQLPVESQAILQEQEIPEVYKTLASNICALSPLNPDMLFNDMLAGIIANSLYEYRHTPKLMKQVMEQLETDYANKAAFMKEMSSTEADDYLHARALSLPSIDELRAKFEFDSEGAQNQRIAKLKADLPDIEISDLEPLVLKQVEREREKAFINSVIERVVKPQIEAETSQEASKALGEVVEAAVELLQAKIEAKLSLAGRLFSYVQAPVQTQLTTKVEGIYRDIFQSEETNAALVSHIACAIITTMHAARNPSENLKNKVIT